MSRSDENITSPSRAEERRWIRRAQEGHHADFEKLVRRYSRNVYGLALSLCGDPEDAEEVAQEAMVKAFRKIRTYEFKAPFCSWLLSITRNTFKDLVRKRSKSRRKRQAYKEQAQHAAPQNPEELAHRKSRMRSVHDGLGRVPEPYREAVHLYDIQGLSYLEIASVCGVSMGTVKSRISRGRVALREVLMAAGGIRLKDGDKDRDGKHAGDEQEKGNGKLR